MADERSVDPLIGQLVEDRYRILGLLGAGGMGAVYEAEQVRLGRRVAIKTIHAPLAQSVALFERFEREARAAAAIGSPHIVEVYDRGVLPDGAPYMVMERLDGEDLDRRLARGPLAARDAIAIARQACKALSAAHAHGIVHRDVKPANLVLIERPDEPVFVKVVDFGISKLRDSALTGTHEMLGTPYAMAPEQLRDSSTVDARADVYGMGVVLYHALSGRPPYEAPSLPSLIAKILQEERAPLSELAPHLPAALVSIVETAMATRPEDRFQSCAALGEALAGVDAQLGSPVSPFEPTVAAAVSPPAVSPPVPTPAPHAEPPKRRVAPTAPMTDRPWERAAQRGEPSPERPPTRWPGRVAIGAIALSVLGATAFAIWTARDPGRPADAPAEGSGAALMENTAASPNDRDDAPATTSPGPADTATERGSLAPIPDVPEARPRPAPPGAPTQPCFITVWPPMRLFVDGEDLGLTPIEGAPIAEGVRSFVAREESGTRAIAWLYEVDGIPDRPGGPTCASTQMLPDTEGRLAAYPPGIARLFRRAQSRGASCGHGVRQTLHLRIRVPADPTVFIEVEVTGGDAEATECLRRLVSMQAHRSVRATGRWFEVDVPVH